MVAAPNRVLTRITLNNAYFGDTHVHTAFSNDAWAFNVRVTPGQGLRFCLRRTGVLCHRMTPQDVSTRPVAIDRPLDFMAVTDHSEFLGEQTLCLDPKL